MKTLLFLSLVFCSQAFAQDNCLSSIESTLIKADFVTERFEESIDYISANLVVLSNFLCKFVFREPRKGPLQSNWVTFPV
jgi:hypothetical protein